jgi:hypothetical protein
MAMNGKTATEIGSFVAILGSALEFQNNCGTHHRQVYLADHGQEKALDHFWAGGTGSKFFVHGIY